MKHFYQRSDGLIIGEPDFKVGGRLGRAQRREGLSTGRQELQAVSNQGVFSGPSAIIVIVALGIFGLFEPLLFIVFIAVLGYYLYRLEKRVSAVEGSPQGQRPKQS